MKTKNVKRICARVLAIALSMTTLFTTAACDFNFKIGEYEFEFNIGHTGGGNDNTGGGNDNTGGGNDNTGGGNDNTGGGTTEEEKPLVIQIANFGGGIGRKWLDDAGARFAELVKDVEYTPGKKGVSFEVTSTTSVKIKNAGEQRFNMFFVQGAYNDYMVEILKGDILDITDIVAEQDLTAWGEPGVKIIDKIPEEYREAFKGNDGKYYMLPHYEAHSATSYDVDMFTNTALYLAQPEMGVPFETDLIPGQTFYFTGTPANKTVGNDGVAGTDDDGMPTTLNELVAQCAYIHSKRIAVFSTAGIGAHIDYSNHLINALWTALAGYEDRRAVSTHAGTVDYVTGISNVELWPGTGIMKPVTEEVTLAGDSTDGYKAIDQAGRYYANAFMELAFNQGWIYKRFTESNYTHKEAMKAFILNGIGGMDKIAGHIEGTYWYNEAEGYGLFNDYRVLSGTGVNKNIGYWHMPTSVGNDVVTSPENARDEVLINSYTAHMLLNGNMEETAGNEGLIQACKDFFMFLCTDAELKAFTATTGSAKSLYAYDINEEVLADLDPYQQEVMRARSNANAEGPVVVNQYGTTPTFRNKAAYFTYAASQTGLRPYFDGVQYMAALEVFHKSKQAGDYKNAWKCFEVTGYSESKWMTEIYVR